MTKHERQFMADWKASCKPQPRTEGTYTLEEVVKAVRVYCVLQGWSLCVVNALIDDLRARLTAAPKPTKQERVALERSPNNASK